MKPNNMPLGAIQIKRATVRQLALDKIQSITNTRADYSAQLPDLMAVEVATTRKKLWARLFHRKLSDQDLFDTWVRESSYFDHYAGEYRDMKVKAMFFADDQMKACKKLLALSNAPSESETMWISDDAYAAIRQ